MIRKLSNITVLICILSIGVCQTHADTELCDVHLGEHRAVTSVKQTRFDWWLPRHEDILKRNKEGDVNLIFIGDSITHGLEKEEGKEVWDKYYSPRGAVNMGFSSDRTEHVLWRLNHGELDGISPKLAIILIGTNNSWGNEYTHKQVAEGIKAIVCKVRTKLPATKVLLLAIFPRGSYEQCKAKEKVATMNSQWKKNDQVNKIVSQLADNEMIYYLNINDIFLTDDGILTNEMFPDLLHPKQKAYKIWAQAMEPTIVKLMEE